MNRPDSRAGLEPKPRSEQRPPTLGNPRPAGPPKPQSAPAAPIPRRQVSTAHAPTPQPPSRAPQERYAPTPTPTSRPMPPYAQAPNPEQRNTYQNQYEQAPQTPYRQDYYAAPPRQVHYGYDHTHDPRAKQQAPYPERVGYSHTTNHQYRDEYDPYAYDGYSGDHADGYSDDYYEAQSRRSTNTLGGDPYDHLNREQAPWIKWVAPVLSGLVFIACIITLFILLS